MQQDIKAVPASPFNAQIQNTPYAQIPVRMPDQPIEGQVDTTNPMAGPAQPHMNTESEQQLDKILKDTSQAVKKAEPNQSMPAPKTSSSSGPKKPVLAIFAAVAAASLLLIAAFASFNPSG